MAGNVNGHAQLEPEGIVRIEDAQADEQAHCCHSVGQLIQHRAELGALIEVPRRVSIDRVQQAAYHVAP